MSVQIPQGRTGGSHDRPGTYLLLDNVTRTKRRKPLKRCTPYTQARQEKRPQNKAAGIPLCLQPASPCTKNAGKSLKGSRVPFFCTLRNAIADHYQVERRRGGHLALFLSLGIGWNLDLFLKLWGGANAHTYCILCYTMVMVAPLLSRR